MELPPSLTGGDTPFEWSELLDFALDDDPLFSGLEPYPLLQPQPQPPPPPPPVPPVVSVEETSSEDRVRKRDPRMVCENFLAGLVPCACPEMDAKMEEEEEEEIAHGKKRVRVGRTRTPAASRCQVPGCEVDISELKGYHRRHRVCLACANAVSVLINGETKRYCQQCGKFHLLPDFDEGKRSCRRKLERHNNRRRRKPADSRVSVQKDSQIDLHTEDVSSDGEACKENAWSSSQIAGRDDSKDGTLSNLCSPAEADKIDTESNMTSTQVEKVSENSKQDQSPPSDNKSGYSSVCPTGRISFKLYDWNPAEFPRRLRHQIFQWLANMPVELEGYVRPGCTILTSFVSMPQFMWVKLFEDPASYIQSSVGPGGMISGRGAVLVYLNDVTFRILRDGASVMKVKVAMRAPKLHYIYPPCFEAGKPVDLIVCGSNLLQPKFRSLISFAGKYLVHDYYVAFPDGKDYNETTAEFDRQFCSIHIPHTEPSFFGPAFIEVENECGLSNFLPVLIGDERVCAEIMMIHESYDFCHCGKKSQVKSSGSSYGNCEVSCSRQTAFSEFMLDVAWLLKWPCPEKLQGVMSSCQIQRFKCLLAFLISNKSIFILERILQSLQLVWDEIESSDVSTITDIDRKSLKDHCNHARDYLYQTVCKDELLLQHVRDPMLEADELLANCVDNGIKAVDYARSQVLQMIPDTKSRLSEASDSPRNKEIIPLLDRKVAMNIEGNREWPTSASYLMSSKKLTISRPLVYMIAVVAVCCAVCAIVFHPHKVAKFAVTIRCVFGRSSNIHG